MKKFKAILLLVFIFLVSVIIGFLFEAYYESFVRWLLQCYSHDRIVFGGKFSFLFGSNYFIFSFAIFAVIFSILIYKSNKKLVQLAILLVLFLLTTFISTWINSISLLTSCTACKDGIVRLNYLNLPYNWHLIISLIVSILPLAIEFISTNRKSARQ